MRTFALDARCCPRCNERLRLVALMTEPNELRRYLRALGEPTEPRDALPRAVRRIGACVRFVAAPATSTPLERHRLEPRAGAKATGTALLCAPSVSRHFVTQRRASRHQLPTHLRRHRNARPSPRSGANPVRFTYAPGGPDDAGQATWTRLDRPRLTFRKRAHAPPPGGAPSAAPIDRIRRPSPSLSPPSRNARPPCSPTHPRSPTTPYRSRTAFDSLTLMARGVVACDVRSALNALEPDDARRTGP